MSLPSGPSIIGVVHTQDCLTATETSAILQSCDLFEVRWDTFDARDEMWREWIALQQRPLVMTARSEKEGGKMPLPIADRARLLTLSLPHAIAIDVELSSLSDNPEEMDSLIAEARQAEVSVILSFHDFEKTPDLEDLVILARSARAAGADVFKAATLTETAEDLATLLRLAHICDTDLHQSFSLMGMGRYGKVSRLALAQAGSVLNYCAIEEEAAPGQWFAEEFAATLRELGLR